MQAGELRHRLTIRRPNVSTDADGGQHLDHADVATVWGHVAPLRMAESIIAEQVAARASHKITLRYRAGLLPSDQLVLETGRVFEITSIRNRDERNRELEVLALEKVAG
jgi:SPP1 family predicted phage head-tail adaptor